MAATIFNFIAAFFIGKRAAKKPFDFEENGINSAFAQGDVQIQEVKVDARFFINWALTIGSFVLIFMDVIQSYYVFMLAMALALAVNYKTVKEWNSAIDRFAPEILRMVMMVFTAGVFVGILTKSNMMSEMAQSIINIIPTSASRSFGLLCRRAASVHDRGRVHRLPGYVRMRCDTADPRLHAAGISGSVQALADERHARCGIHRLHEGTAASADSADHTAGGGRRDHRRHCGLKAGWDAEHFAGPLKLI